MGTGPNWASLDKGMKANGSTAYAFGEVLLIDTAIQSVKRGTTAATAADVAGVCQETVDATKVATGKVFVNTRFTGISKCIAGANIAKGARLINNTSCQMVTQSTAGGPVLAIALEAVTTGAGTMFDALLTPGATL